jgi:hypothetical protein
MVVATLFGFGFCLLGCAAAVFITQGQNTWVPQAVWLGPLLFLLGMACFVWARIHHRKSRLAGPTTSKHYSAGHRFNLSGSNGHQSSVGTVGDHSTVIINNQGDSSPPIGPPPGIKLRNAFGIKVEGNDIETHGSGIDADNFRSGSIEKNKIRQIADPRQTPLSFENTSKPMEFGEAAVYQPIFCHALGIQNPTILSVKNNNKSPNQPIFNARVAIRYHLDGDYKFTIDTNWLVEAPAGYYHRQAQVVDILWNETQRFPIFMIGDEDKPALPSTTVL